MASQLPQQAVALPTPALVVGSVKVVAWGSKPYTSSSPGSPGNGLASLADLVGYGESAPPPLQLNPVERCALAYWGGWIQVQSRDKPADMHTMKKGADGSWRVVEANPNAGQPVTGPGAKPGQKQPATYQYTLPAVSWASNPGWKVATTVQDSQSGPLGFRVVIYGYGDLATLYPSSGLDAVSNGNAPTAMNLFAWGNAVPPSLRLTDIEMRAILQSGDDAGWCKMRGPGGTGINQLTDARFAKQPDGTWVNRNHPETNLGIVTDVASKPKHGVAGFVDAVFHDVTHDPLGAILFVVVAVSAAELLPILAGAAQVAVVAGSALTSPGTVAQTAVDLAEHPAEIGRTVGAAEVAIAAGAVGLKGLGNVASQAIIGGGNFGDSQSPQTMTQGTQPQQSQGAGRKWWQILGGT